MFSHYATRKISPICKISTFSEDHSFLNATSHLKYFIFKMLLKSIIIFVICNYMREILNMNICKVYVHYKTLFIERQCCVFMSLAQGTCAVAASSRENCSNNLTTLWCWQTWLPKGTSMSRILYEQNLPQRLAFRETINSILTATKQEQLTYIVLIVPAEIPEREGSIYPSSFYMKLPNY